jgi:hypothetical protein
MTDRPSPHTPPIVAGPARRVFHTLLSIAGWAVFLYWWWLVFRRVSSHEIRFTALFIAISIAAIVVVTLIWAWHNLRIYRRRGPRTQVREGSYDFSHDGVGRPVTFPAAGPDRSSAPVIYVRWTDEGKYYDPAAALPPRTGAAAPLGEPWRTPPQKRGA